MKTVMIVLCLFLASCSQSFADRMEDRTGCSGSQREIGECLSVRFAGSDPHDLEKALFDSGFKKAASGTYVYAGPYSYGITVMVRQRSGKVHEVTAV